MCFIEDSYRYVVQVSSFIRKRLKSLFLVNEKPDVGRSSAFHGIRFKRRGFIPGRKIKTVLSRLKGSLSPVT